MKITSRSFLIFIMFSCINSYAQKSQKVDVLWGKEYKDSKKATLGDIIGYDESGFYTVNFAIKGKYGLVLEHFDTEMNRTKTASLELKQSETSKYGQFLRSMYLNDRLYLFSAYGDKWAGHNSLYVQEVDKSSLQFKGKAKKVASLNLEGVKRRNSGGFNFDLSEDSSKVLIYYLMPFEKKGKEKIGFKVLGADFNELWEKEVELPYADELFEINNYQVSNQGDVYVLAKLMKEKKDRDKKKVNYSHKILAYSSVDKNEKEFTVEVGERFLQEMRIIINTDNDIICAGFYSETYNSGIKGSFFLKIDGDTKQILTENFKEFSFDFITQNMRVKDKLKAKKKEAKGKNIGLAEYDIRDIILREDGGAVLVAEQFFITQSTYTDANGNTRTTYYYHYNDIIVVNINAEGQIEWTEKIAKRQTTGNDGGFYSSYALSVTNDKLYFIFNDNGRNLLYNGTGKVEGYKRGKDAVVTMVDIDSDGRQNREALYITVDVKVYTRPKVCEQISDKEMIIFGQRKKIRRFGKITFKD